MKVLFRPVSTKTDASYHKYLKPGALALLRDSRVSSRSHRSSGSSTRLDLARRDPDAVRTTDVAPAMDMDVVDRVPVFTGTCYGPRCVGRKKLFAARSVLLQSLEGRESSGSVVGNDVVLAH